MIRVQQEDPPEPDRPETGAATGPSSAPVTFVRPHRPFGAGMINAACGALNRIGLLKPLDGERILQRARRKTGLCDWGRDDCREPLDQLVRSLEGESHLTPVGRILAAKMLESHAMNLLQIQRYADQHPEVRDIPIRRPVFITGLPRTGTTLLQNLFGRDPRARSLRTWECIWPVPPRGWSGRGADPRIRRTRWLGRAIRFLAPGLEAAHRIDPEGLEECTWLTRNSFVSAGFLLFGRQPGYYEWLLGLDEDRIIRCFEHYRLQLQVLTHQRGGAYWVLKSPIHLAVLDPLLQVFPDARVVQTHRDPLRVVPSCCSLFALMRSIFSDDIVLADLGREIADMISRTLERATAAREKHPGSFVDVRYEELIRDKVGTVRRVYAQLDLPFNAVHRQSMERWLVDDRHRGVHRYAPQQFGLDEEGLAVQFADYRREFVLPAEDPGLREGVLDQVADPA